MPPTRTPGRPGRQVTTTTPSTPNHVTRHLQTNLLSESTINAYKSQFKSFVWHSKLKDASFDENDLNSNLHDFIISYLYECMSPDFLNRSKSTVEQAHASIVNYYVVTANRADTLWLFEYEIVPEDEAVSVIKSRGPTSGTLYSK